jgi:predicted kinase
MLVDLVGLFTLDLAIIEKRNIVIELIAADRTDMLKLIDIFQGIGYKVKIVHIDSSAEECYRNTLKKSADNMSCFFCQDIIFRWLRVVLQGTCIRE